MDDEKQPVRWPVFVVVGILIVFGGIFVYELVQLSESGSGVAEEDLTAETYMELVEVLLADADPSLGADLLDEHGCLACHGGSNAGRLAPGFADLPDVAAERHPPLQAAAYIYEAIIYPGAHTVTGYPNNMPRNYDAQIPDDELGHIIAYLVAGAETVEVTPESEPETTPDAAAVEITADTYMLTLRSQANRLQGM
jgi:cytochrome c5